VARDLAIRGQRSYTEGWSKHSAATAASSQDIGNLGAMCAGTGIKTINIGIGTSTL
jgi:hypothetical protein